jgi:hypothetical protein
MKKLIASLGFFCLVFQVIGQDEKVVIIDKSAYKSEVRNQRTKKLVDNTSVVKFSPLQMIAGEINFGYERKISDYSSIEIEFGPTLSNIGLSVNQNHYYVDPFGSYNYVDQTSKVGFFLSTGFRFYPADNGKVLNGFYVSPVIKYRLMNNGLHDYSGNLDDTKGSESDVNFSFNFGFQKWVSSRFSLDFFGGVGLAYESYNTKEVVSAYNSTTQLYDYYWKRNTYDGVRFLITGGIKVGIGN